MEANREADAEYDRGKRLEQKMIKDAVRLGIGKVRRVLHTAVLLREDWEMDNRGWIVEMEDGSTAALTTNHGHLCRWEHSDAKESLAEAEGSLNSIRRALEVWPQQNG